MMHNRQKYTPQTPQKKCGELFVETLPFKVKQKCILRKTFAFKGKVSSVTMAMMMNGGWRDSYDDTEGFSTVHLSDVPLTDWWEWREYHRNEIQHVTHESILWRRIGLN